MRKVKLSIPESSVKSAVEERLQIAQNQGSLLFLRLNSGDFIEARGNTRRRIKGCPIGTADFVVFQGGLQGLPICETTFIECKASSGRTTKEQNEFAEKATQQNCRYFVVKDASMLEEILEL